MANHILLEGFITDVQPVEYYDDSDKRKRRQHIILNIPQWRDSMGDLRGRVEDWKIVAMNEFIDKNNISTALIGKRVKAECVISSKHVRREPGDLVFYPISVRLKVLTIVPTYLTSSADPDEDIIKESLKGK